MEVVAKTRKVGGSLMISIPKAVVEKEDLKSDQLVKVRIEPVLKSGFGIVRDLPSFKKSDRFRGQLE